MINVALIGHGYWGSILEKYITPKNGFNLKHICDSKSDLNKVWDDTEIEAVIIAVRNEQRYPLVKLALLCGKHVLTEKPLALKLTDAQELAHLAKWNEIALAIDYTFTVSKNLQLARNIIKNGEIGKLIGFDMSVNHLAPFGGGSVYWILGSHMLSVLDMFIPLETLSYKRKDIVTYKGAVETGVIETEKGQIHLSLNYPNKTVEIVLYGENGTVVYNPNIKDSLIIEWYERLTWVKVPNLPVKREVFQVDETNNLKYMMEYFHDVINKKSQSNVATALKITKILEELHNA